MIQRFVCILSFVLASPLTSHAGEVIWHPLLGNDADGVEHISGIGQIGSEVHMSVAIHVFADSCDIPSVPVSVEFPTLFVVSCDYGFPRAADIVIYNFGRTSDSYDYGVGDGWIYHRKGFANCGEVTDSLGWVYIKQYPWVYTPDGGGWRYVVEAGIFEYSNAWWFYEPDYGWYWSTRNLYPVIYHQGVGWTRYGLISGQ